MSPQKPRIHPETREYDLPLNVPTGTEVWAVECSLNRTKSPDMIYAIFETLESAQRAARTGKENGFYNLAIIQAFIKTPQLNIEDDIDLVYGEKHLIA